MKKYIGFFALALMLLSGLPLRADDNTTSDDAAIVRNLDIFNSLYRELTTYYVDTLNAERTIENAINAMLDDIDPYTEYIPAKDMNDFNVVSTGQYGGIGSYIMQRTDSAAGVYISSPYEGSPAARAGLRPGDRIDVIDGDSVKGWSSDRVSSKLKGQAHTPLQITITRPYDPDSVKTFTIMRDNIKVNPVPYYGVVHGDMGYISLTTYNEASASAVKEAVMELKNNPAVKGLVLDLRGNGGGLLESAVQIVGLFVPKGTQVVMTRSREKSSEKVYKTTSDPIDTRIPLVVLVDGGTASSSEITAGALQDLDRAVIVGSRSFGKGLVQTTRPLPFDGTLKVTISKYYIPSGRLIQEVDYAQRNADGSYKRNADSLAHVFHTAHGREVRDGGGITPDVKVEPIEPTRLVYNIVRDQWAFDYATRFAATHPSIATPDKFEIDDSIWNDFKRFIDPSRFNYDRVCENGLKQLRELAKTEGYANDETAEAFDKLETLLKHDLDHDLDLHREIISKYLAQEILDRYYFVRGQVEYSVRHDKAIDEAHRVLADPAQWARTLGLKK